MPVLFVQSAKVIQPRDLVFRDDDVRRHEGLVSRSFLNGTMICHHPPIRVTRYDMTRSSVQAMGGEQGICP